MTINDILKALECCSGYNPKCEDCPYCGIGMCEGVIREDAVLYLKEYKNLLDSQKEENDPLTLEELKAMRGKPVWIEYIEGDYENEWVLVVKNPERPIFGTPTLLAFARDGERIYLTISGYGKRWQAYRNMK